MPGSLFWSARETWWRSWTVYDDGIALHPRWRADQVMYWVDVQTVIVDLGTFAAYQAELGSVLTQAWWSVRLSSRSDASRADRLELPLSGRLVRTLATDFRRYGVRDDKPGWECSEVYDWVTNNVATCQLPLVRAKLDNGETVEFGPVRATASGLSQDNAADLPWSQVAWIGTNAPYDPFVGRQLPSDFLVRAKDNENLWLRCRPSQVQNMPTLIALARSLGDWPAGP